MNKFVLSFVFASVFVGSVSAKILEVGYFELENGLQVAVVENHKAPVGLQMLFYKTGSINDPKGKGGIAHLLEHMMFRGTKKLKDKEFDRITEKFGARNNAFTSFGVTAYHEFTDISKLELMMALEAERMRGLVIDEEAFITERDVVLQERKQRFETNPVTIFYENMNKMLWQEHPLANAVSGSAEEIVNLSLNDAVDFYNRYYHPNNALLVLNGDITLDEAKVLANKYYGKIKSGPKVEELNLPNGREIHSNVISKIKGVKQPRFVRYYRFDAGELSKSEELALDLLCDYLTEDDTAILYDNIVYKDKSLLNIVVSSSYENRFGGKLSIYATPIDDKQNIYEIEKIIDEGIEKALAKLDEKELDKIKNSTLSSAIYLQENPSSSVNFVVGLLFSGYSIDEIENFDEVIKAITVDDLLKVWEKVKASKVKVNGYVGGVSDEI